MHVSLGIRVLNKTYDNYHNQEIMKHTFGLHPAKNVQMSQPCLETFGCEWGLGDDVATLKHFLSST